MYSIGNYQQQQLWVFVLQDLKLAVSNGLAVATCTDDCIIWANWLLVHQY